MCNPLQAGSARRASCPTGFQGFRPPALHTKRSTVALRPRLRCFPSATAARPLPNHITKRPTTRDMALAPSWGAGGLGGWGMGDPLASFGFLDPLAYAGGGPTFTLAQQPMGARAQQATAAVSERVEKRGPAFLRIQHPLSCPAPCSAAAVAADIVERPDAYEIVTDVSGCAACGMQSCYPSSHVPCSPPHAFQVGEQGTERQLAHCCLQVPGMTPDDITIDYQEQNQVSSPHDSA